MSAVVGCDLSTHAIDLVKLEESSNRAEWVRVELHGKTAWERTLDVRNALGGQWFGRYENFWDDVLLVAVETPTPDQKRVLRLVQGAVVASLPAHLRTPERCVEVHQQTWKKGLGFSGKPGYMDVGLLSGAEFWNDDQNARDAYCIALWARDSVASGSPVSPPEPTQEAA